MGNDYWYNTKRGLLADSLAYWRACLDDEEQGGANSTIADAVCTLKARPYFTEVLKGSAGDWNDDDFDVAKRVADKPTGTSNSGAVDVRISFLVTAASSASVQLKELTTAAPAMKIAMSKVVAPATASASAGAAAADISIICTAPESVGTKLSIVCRINTRSTLQAEEVQNTARDRDGVLAARIRDALVSVPTRSLRSTL